MAGRTILLIPLKGGSWRVTEGGQEVLQEFPGKEAALRFAESWALAHAPSEVWVYGENGQLQRIDSYPKG